MHLNLSVGVTRLSGCNHFRYLASNKYQHSKNRIHNMPSSVIITTEDDEDEIGQKLSCVESDTNSTENGTQPSADGQTSRFVSIKQSKRDDDDGITTATSSSIIPAPPPKKNHSVNNFLNKSVGKSVVNSISRRFDPDATQHKKRGTGVLASDADLSASPEVFARGCVLLQLCAIGNLTEVQNYISNALADVNFRDYDRRTALHVASSEGRLVVVKYLIAKGARVNRTDRWGGSPLDDAHRHRHTDVAKYLRSKGGKSGSLNLTTTLITAAAAGDIEGAF